MNATAIHSQFYDLVVHPRFQGATMDSATIEKDEGYFVTLPTFTLPPGWSCPQATLSFWISSSFPFQPPSHGFWTEEDVRLDYGRLPQWTRSPINQYRYRPARGNLHWLYRPSCWSCNADTLTTYAHFVRQRFNRLR